VNDRLAAMQVVGYAVNQYARDVISP